MQPHDPLDLMVDTAARQARALAVRYMTRSPRSRSQVTNRLLQAGFAEQVVEPLINEFVENGMINDQELARRWVTDRSGRKQYGARRLLKELQSHGVSRQNADEALDQLTLDTEIENARAAAFKRWPEHSLRDLSTIDFKRELSRCSGFLLRRGYSHEVIGQVLKSLT